MNYQFNPDDHAGPEALGRARLPAAATTLVLKFLYCFPVRTERFCHQMFI